MIQVRRSRMVALAVAFVIVSVMFVLVSAAPPSLSGKVTRFNGNPIANLNVSAYNLSTGEFVLSNVTDAGGNYYLDLASGGDYYVIFNKSGYIYGSYDYRNITVTVGAGEAKVLNASLYADGHGSYNLTVKDVWNGRPIPNANVTIYPSGYPFNPAVSGLTDANGNVVLESVANHTGNAGVLHDINVTGTGYVSKRLESLSIYEGTNQNVNVTMSGACLVYGDIRDSENNLVNPMIAGAYLEVWDNTNTFRVGWGGSYYYSDLSDGSGHYSIRYPSTLAGASDCNVYLHVNASGYVSKNSVPVQSSDIADVNLTGRAYVSGSLFDASNTSQPISGALVRVIDLGSTVYQQLSSAAGGFNISVKDGMNHTIEISVPDYAVYANSTVYNTSIDYGTILLSGLGTLNGTVVDETNSSILLQGVTVKIAGDGAVYTTATDSSGRFGIIVKNKTLYTLSFNISGYFSNTTQKTALGETDIGSISLRGKNRVHGQVSDTLNLRNTSVGGAKVEFISNLDSKRYTVYTNASGGYSLFVPSTINDYVMRFDKAGYNISQSNYSLVNDALINANLKGATHVEGTITDAYSPVEPLLSSVLVEAIDGSGNVYYSTYSGASGRYSLDLGVDFAYSLRATKSGYAEKRVLDLPWDQDRSGTGGTDRVQDITMNGTTSVYVKTVDAFDNMSIDNSVVCVLYNDSSCFYTKTTGIDGETRFNIRGGSSYRLKINRDGYVEKILPLSGGSLTGNFSQVVSLEAYASIYVYDRYALNNEEVYGAYVEVYLYSNQTNFTYDLNETILNVSAYCNGTQRDDINVTLEGITYSYYSSQNTTGGSPVVSFRTVPVGYHNLTIDGASQGCGYSSFTINIASGGLFYSMSYSTDSVAPEITNVTESADPVELGSVETVSADVNDTLNSVDTVLIEIGGVNYTMTNVSDVTYQYSWVPSAIGVVPYTIYANDTQDNINQTSGSITVQDTTGPTVALNYPDGDTISVSTVSFNYTPTELSLFSKCELWTNTTGSWALNASNSSAVVNGSVNSIVVSGISEGYYRWNVNCTDISGNSNFSSADKYFNVSGVVVPDNSPPTYSQVQQNDSSPAPGKSALLSALWNDDVLLGFAVLETNESGTWQNKTVYGSPKSLSGASSWSNFTWVNASVPSGATVGWRIWANDSSGNWNVTPVQSFVVTEGVSLTVYVYDTDSNPAGADFNGDGVNVTVYNSTVSESQNTTTLGYTVFNGLADGGIYNVSVNGTMQGYGLNATYNLVLSGDSQTTVILNITKLIVNVTDSSFVPIANANVTVFLSDNVTVAKNATGGNMTGKTSAGGIVTFNRALPCTDCNVTVEKNDGGPVVNSTRVSIIAGNSSNYVWLDPPQTKFDLNFTLNSDIVPVNVSVIVRVYNSSTVIGSNKTDSSGNAVVYNVPSGIYDFIIDGEALGYSKDVYSHIVVGKVVQSTGTTDVNGRISLDVNGLITYYVAVTANGYESYDDLNESVERVGSFDDSINTSGISPMIRIALPGNTTLTGYVYDGNFYQPMNLSYEPVSGAVVRMYTKTSCDTIPSPTLLRYQAVSAANGTYSMIVSPVMKDSPQSMQDYCMNVSASGFIDGKLNDINVNSNIAAPLTGSGVVTGFVKTQDNTSFIGGASVLLRSSQCYGGTAGPVASCEAYRGTTSAGGYFSFNVNPRNGTHSYVPYTAKVSKIGYNLLDGMLISTLPSLSNYYYLVPASVAALKVNVSSDYGELISDKVYLEIGGAGVTLNNSDCTLSANVYTCILSYGDYNLTVNGTTAGYDDYTEAGISVTGEVKRNVQLAVTRANITLMDENGQPLSGVNVTINTTPAMTNTTATGSALFYRVPIGLYSVNFSGLSDYLGVFDSTLNVASAGAMNAKVFYANETQFYVNISNGTFGVENVSVEIGSLFNETNSTGEIFFEKVNNSITGSYVVGFNKTDLYLRGYFPPNVSVELQPGLDRESGNNLTIVLNRTTGYGIFMVNTSLAAVNVSFWYNLTDYIEYKLSDAIGISFFELNVSEHNETLYLQASKAGYQTSAAGPYNTSDGNFTYVNVTMTPYPTCSEGVISSMCYCGATYYGSGYCCSGSYQTSVCGGGSSSGGGSSTVVGSSGGGSSSGGGVIIIDTGPDEVYDIDIYVGMYNSLNIVGGVGRCVDVPFTVRNTGDTALENLNVRLEDLDDKLAADFDTSIGFLNAGEERPLNIRICSDDGLADDGDYENVLSVENFEVRKQASFTIRVTHEGEDVYLALRARLDSLTSTLLGVDVSVLTTELKGYYDSAAIALKDAEDALEEGDYDSASAYLDDAEEDIFALLRGIDELGKVPQIADWHVMIAVGLALLFALVVLRKLFLRRPEHAAGEALLPKDVPLSVPALRIPSPAISSVRAVPRAIMRILGMHDVYYAHSLSKRKYLTDVIEKVLELRCPKCGGKVFRNRCVWCGEFVRHADKKENETAPHRVEGIQRRDIPPEPHLSGNVYYTHQSKRDESLNRFKTDALVHVAEGVCRKCGGRVYKGRCVWCG